MYVKEYEKLWLDYKKLEDIEGVSDKFLYIYTDFSDEITENAVREIETAWECFFGKKLKRTDDEDFITEHFISNTIIFKKIKDSTVDSPYFDISGSFYPGNEGFIINYDQHSYNIIISSNTSAGALYGAFALVRHFQCGKKLIDINIQSKPDTVIRMIDHWDNMWGDIERGYSGNSFFFDENKVLFDDRIRMYARLMASIGINAITINNVNVHSEETLLITDKYLPIMKQFSDLFNSYGIKLHLSINYAAPMVLGVTDTSDPLDDNVIKWWEKTVRHIYEVIPEFGGFLVKADSEGRPGPHTYGRTQADGANMLARCLKPYGGIVSWRCFVYNCKQDWRDKKTDRAKAAYDNFINLDGTFEDNVILQIKNGPVDFQVREPVSPLFGAMNNTKLMLEVQPAQEYTGQQRHVCYLIPMWKEIIDFNMYANKNGTDNTVGEIVYGIAGVTNTGNDPNWTGHDLAGANLFGYGMLLFDHKRTSEDIADEWIRCTFGNNEIVNKAIYNIIINSWLTYEKYTAPLGIGWMVDPPDHYGPNVDGFEYSVWGTYHYSDCKGLGRDRSVATGTGFAGQYNKPLCDIYEKIETTPDELLLFFHRAEYTYKLHSGKTVIQHIYDTHFEGVEDVERMIETFKNIEGLLDPKRYERILERLNIQLESSREWRDIINTYYHRMSGIDDEKGRTIY